MNLDFPDLRLLARILRVGDNTPYAKLLTIAEGAVRRSDELALSERMLDAIVSPSAQVPASLQLSSGATQAGRSDIYAAIEAAPPGSMAHAKTFDKERKGSMPAIQDEGYPYRMRMGEIADAIGRSVTIPGNLGVVQLLNTIVELRRELADLRENYEYQRARADHHAARIAGQALSATRETIIEQCITALDTHGLASIVTPDKALTVRQVLRSLYVKSRSDA